jgi:hypothetical protein
VGYCFTDNPSRKQMKMALFLVSALVRLRVSS